MVRRIPGGMVARRNRTDSLASNMALLTLLLVSVSVTIISLAALTGVYGLASTQAAARQIAYRQAVGAELGARMDAVTRVADRAAQMLSNATTQTVDRAALAAVYEAGVEYIDRLIIARPDGTVVTGFPIYQLPDDVHSESYFQGAMGIEPEFVQVGGQGGALWVRRSVEASGSSFVVLARVRTSFLQVLLDSFSSDASKRVAYIADLSGQLIVVGRAGLVIDSSTPVYHAESEALSRGQVSAMTTDGLMLVGEFEKLRSFPGLDWTVAVVEPRSSTLHATWAALLPAAGAFLLTGSFAIGIAFIFARRVAAPLRDLELQAREVASGAYGRTIDSDRTDEVGRLADAFNMVTVRLNALQELSQLLARSTSFGQVIDGIIVAIGHIVGSARVAVFLVDEARQHLLLVRGQGLDVIPGTVVGLDSEPWLANALWSQGPASFAGTAEEFERTLPGAGAWATGAIAAPLLSGREPLGVIVIIPDARREFTEAEVEMVRAFSAQAAVAVNISRLFEEETEARLEAEALRDVAERLTTPGDFESALEQVLSVASDLLSVDVLHVAFLERSSLGLSPSPDPLADRILLRAWKIAWEAADGDSVVRMTAGENAEVDAFLEETNVAEALLLTVMRGLAPAGVIALAPGAGREFGARERALADALGTEIGLALEAAYNFAQAEFRAANLETVFRISQAVSSSLQIKVVLNRVLDVVQKIFSADAVALMQYDETKHVVSTAMARGLVSAEMLHFEVRPGVDIPGAVFTSGEPFKHDDIADTDSEYAGMAFRQGLRTILSVPLLARGRSIGVLSVFSATPAAFTAEDMSLLHTFGSQAALAIDTAALYGQEHHVASVLQASILPQRLPEFPEVEASSVYLAAGHQAEIGGDYFDLFKSPDDSIVFAIGDVCGKGVEAATKTSRIKYSVRAFIAAGLGPGRTLEEVNRIVAASQETGDIVTLVVGVIDTRTGVLSYANGGHPPGLLLDAENGRMTRLETTGPLLGAINDASYEENETRISEGDVIVMYTDGVTEARRGNKFFGEGRVRRALAQGGSAAEVADRLLAALDRFVPGNLRDDAAVLTLKLRGRRE